jgi:hypothetical protein
MFARTEGMNTWMHRAARPGSRTMVATLVLQAQMQLEVTRVAAFRMPVAPCAL